MTATAKADFHFIPSIYIYINIIYYGYLFVKYRGTFFTFSTYIIFLICLFCPQSDYRVFLSSAA